MKSIFMNSLVPTWRDHPNSPSVVVFTDLKLCNLNCYYCHNKKEKCNSFLNINELKRRLKIYRGLGFEAVIISGGEPTLNPVEELIEAIVLIKNLGFKVRVDTNGTNPEVVKSLSDYVDGFAVDIKIPLNLIKPKYGKILFSTDEVDLRKVRWYQERLSKTLEILSEEELELNLLRTVEYPLLSEEDKELIEETAKQLEIPHYFNPFWKNPLWNLNF